MKKVLLPLGLASILLATSCQPSREQLAKKYKDVCIENMKKGKTSITADEKKVIEDGCSCMGNKIADKFSAKEIDEMIAMFEKNYNREQSKEIENKMMPVIQPCIEEMMKASAAALQAAPTSASSADTTGRK